MSILEAKKIWRQGGRKHGVRTKEPENMWGWGQRADEKEGSGLRGRELALVREGLARQMPTLVR